MTRLNTALKVQAECPLPETLGTRSVLDFGLLQTWGCLHIHHELPWGQDVGLDVRFLCVSSAPCTRNREVTVHKVLWP